MQAALSATPAVLTIELDTRALSPKQRPPEPLGRDAAEVIAGSVADDLRRIVGETVADAGLILPGALYDVTEVLRPGLPMVEALLDVYRGSLRGGPFEPHLLAIGTAGAHFPVREIAPRRAPGSGPLLVLPFALVAPGPQLDPLRSRLEELLMEKGRPSLHTDQLIRQQFGLTPVHLAYVTFNDLAALLRVQLDHAGFGPLWGLIESALYRPDEPATAELDSGNRFLQLHGRVWTPFLSFDDWTQRYGNGPGGGAVEGYALWTRIQRQYMAGLAAHGLEVILTEPRGGVFADSAEVAISVAQQAALADERVYRETIAGTPDFATASAVTLTEHATSELGPIALTVLVQSADGQIEYLGNEYPLSPEAIAAIRGYWQQQAHRAGATFRVEAPGEPVVSGDPPRLMPFLDYDGTRH
ncbi:MAG: hypothetical protein PVH31_02565 [Ectothiorhodospiraceae bacterium]|jgi:hypothetical protein